MNKSALFFIFLFLISCLGQISSDVYLPALPAIKHYFHTSEHLTQFSLATYMYGFSLSHLIYGPISDHTGRKKPLVIGIAICLMGTLLCRFSPDMFYFTVGRLLQGTGAGAGAVLFLSITSDVYQGNHLAKISSILAIIRVVLLASAPLIGGLLLRFFHWQACFTFLLIYASICLLGSLWIYKETRLKINLQVSHVRHSLKNILQVLFNTVFMRYAFCVMLAFGGILAWLTTLPFLLQNVIGLTPIQFGLISALAGLFFIVGGFVNAIFVEQVGFQKMLLNGLFIMIIASLFMLVFGLMHWLNIFVIMLPVIIYIIGSSFIFSNAYAGAMGVFQQISGTTSAVFGFLQIVGGAFCSTIMSLLHSYTQIPLAIILFLCASIALMLFVM